MITVGLYHFVTINVHWIFTMMATASREIAKEDRVSRSYVNKIIKRYNEANTSIRAPKVCCDPKKFDLYPSEYIEAQ